MTEEHSEDATTAEVRVEDPAAGGPVRGAGPAPADGSETGSQALREMLERTRLQRL